MDRDAAERSHIYQLQSSDAWQVWKQKPAHEKQDGRLVSDFVDDLNPRVISPLKMQVKTVLKETRSQIQHLSVLEDMLSAREQIIFLRRLEELDADRRKTESAKATVIQAKEQLLSKTKSILGDRNLHSCKSKKFFAFLKCLVSSVDSPRKKTAFPELRICSIQGT